MNVTLSKAEMKHLIRCMYAEKASKPYTNVNEKLCVYFELLIKLEAQSEKDES